MRQEYANEVATRIIQQLEQGTAPWQKPWQPGELTLPYNAATGKEYRGMNSMWLAAQGYSDPRWITYNQASDAGAQVRKGSKGTKIIFWKFREEQPATDNAGNRLFDDNGKPKMITVELERPRAFHAVVFNGEQIDGLPALEPRPDLPEPVRHERAETILSSSGAAIRHQAGDRAYYRPDDDSITLPERAQFDSADGYYATALHELGHWTGHTSRLNRDLAHPFGSEGYAREELRAEIASLMLGERLGLGHDPGQHAAYVGSWIKILKDDPREIFRAASDAEKISGFVLDFEQEKHLEHQQQTEASMSVVQGADLPQQSEENAMPNRIYLAVPFDEKDLAKQAAVDAGLTFRWDKDEKSWWAPGGTDLSSLSRWTNTQRNPSPAMKSPEVQFAAALADAGLVLKGMPVMDGSMQRVPVTDDKPGQTSGAYAGHLEGRMAGGYIQNFRTGLQVNWRAEGSIDRLSPEEIAERNKVTAQATLAREENRQRRHESAAQIAAILWKEAPAATADNPYCKNKGISDPGFLGLKVVPDRISDSAAAAGIHIAQTVSEAKELREKNPDGKVFKSGDLLIPGYDADGKLWSIQSVNPSFKSFMKGARKQGLFTVAGLNPEGQSITKLLAFGQQPLMIAEGYATAEKVSRLAEQPVLVAFDSGNIDPVAETLRRIFPDKTMIIAADNDHGAELKSGPDGKPMPNVGLVKAKEAAEKHGAGVAAPAFAKGARGSDWDDLYQQRGEDEARKLFAEQVAVAKQEAAIAADQLISAAHLREQLNHDDPSTTLDNEHVAEERAKATETIARAVSQKDRVSSAATDALSRDRNSRPNSQSADLSAMKHKTQTMRDQASRERQEVSQDDEEDTKQKASSLSTQPKRKRQRRQGIEVDF